MSLICAALELLGNEAAPFVSKGDETPISSYRSSLASSQRVDTEPVPFEPRKFTHHANIIYQGHRRGCCNYVLAKPNNSLEVQVGVTVKPPVFTLGDSHPTSLMASPPHYISCESIDISNIPSQPKLLSHLEAILKFNALLTGPLPPRHRLRIAMKCWKRTTTYERLKNQRHFMDFCATFIQKWWRGHRVRTPALTKDEALAKALVKGWKTRKVLRSHKFQEKLRHIQDLKNVCNQMQEEKDLYMLKQVLSQLHTERVHLFEYFHRLYLNGNWASPQVKILKKHVHTPVKTQPKTPQRVRTPKPSKPREISISLRKPFEFLKRRSTPVKAHKLAWKHQPRVDCWSQTKQSRPSQEPRNSNLAYTLNFDETLAEKLDLNQKLDRNQKLDFQQKFDRNQKLYFHQKLDLAQEIDALYDLHISSRTFFNFRNALPTKIPQFTLETASKQFGSHVDEHFQALESTYLTLCNT